MPVTITAGNAWGTGTASTTVRYDPWPDWFANGTASTTNRVTAGVSMQVNYAVPSASVQQQQHAQQLREEDNRSWTRYQLACDKARALFEELLTPEQLIELENMMYVDLVGSEGNFYRIQCTGSHVGNVLLLAEEHGRTMGKFCCHGPERDNGIRVPPFDHYITQLLFLRADESLFVRTANVHIGQSAYYLQDQFITAHRAARIAAEEEGYREIAQSQAVVAA